MKSASVPFETSRSAMLADPELAALYLEEALAAGDMAAFKLAVRNVAGSRLGGMKALSDQSGLNREALYRAFSDRGNPTLDTLVKVLQALGLRISVSALQSEQTEAA